MSRFNIVAPDGPFYKGNRIVLKIETVEAPLTLAKNESLVFRYVVTGPPSVPPKQDHEEEAAGDVPTEIAVFLQAEGLWHIRVDGWVVTPKEGGKGRQWLRQIWNPAELQFHVLKGPQPIPAVVLSGVKPGMPYTDLKLTSTGNVPMELQPTQAPLTDDMILWAVIKHNSEQFSDLLKLVDRGFVMGTNGPFQGIGAYTNLKETVRRWMMISMSTTWDASRIHEKLKNLYGIPPYDQAQIDQVLLEHYHNPDLDGNLTDYLNHIYNLHKLPGPDQPELDGVIRERLTKPPLCELIFNYFHEEGMLCQCMQVISLRYQNKLLGGGKDPLAAFNTSPLRPLNNLIWGWISDEPQRLSVRRRNYEYSHSYGISLYGKAVSDFQPADNRKAFMGAFNRLLNLLTQFYKQKDDTTVKADAFPIRNALREVHIILSEGAHNQFGDLPWTARLELYTEQIILSRPEMREFLGGRSMVPYPEPWMENVDTMKRLQGWTDVSVQHFNTLARTGEALLLGIRHGGWNKPEVNEHSADNWAVAYRSIVHEYIHSYTAITGVDLSDRRQVDDTMPSVHLRRRLEAQTGKAA